MRIWIGLLSLSVDISSTSDIIRRGLTTIGSQQQKVDGHTSAMSCDVWRVGESIDNALTGRMVYCYRGGNSRAIDNPTFSLGKPALAVSASQTFMGWDLSCD
jgi:hypothetical protein